MALASAALGALAALAQAGGGAASRPASPPRRLTHAKAWVYQLQELDPKAVAARSDWDVLVTDPSREGGAVWWPREAVQRLRRGGRVVLAYLSIGEAERYRPYWRAAWKTHPPSWLGPENPEWKGNYKVRYWQPGWRKLLLKKGGPLRRIVDRGYDGVYLDIVDAWEHWSEAGELTAEEAQRRMVALVREIARQARARRPGFLVVPQNAPQVAVRPKMLAAISGLALEDTFYDGERRRRARDTREVLRLAARVRAAKKPVFAVDYCRRPASVRRFAALARAQGFVPYATVRALNRLTPPLAPPAPRPRAPGPR